MPSWHWWPPPKNLLPAGKKQALFRAADLLELLELQSLRPLLLSLHM